MDFSAQKERLETRLSALSAGMLAGQGLSALTRNANTARAAHSRAGKTTQITEILTALDRLKAGEYGYCRICGADLTHDQLRQNPETPFCESCSA
ncbi:conjugal transfer protein TraR [Epibacterium sp. MM17-32]|uniref:TraR/DksA family transcriptional regulator n=1 Tax=Epibacterium sp. MM17-32 TaxID=2917734 RepID=UPI001EF55024|nr:conjugal transfer protein TraR [Epibacterium sp. MM17-32]MCG7627562.1 conjugal transfer protein TraR [Epibacterium sp. MM17-32]